MLKAFKKFAEAAVKLGVNTMQSPNDNLVCIRWLLDY